MGTSLRGASIVAGVLLALGIMACAPRSATTPATPAPVPDYDIVIPLGAAEAELRGEVGLVIPSPIRVQTGQRIVVRNDDHAMHYFFEQPVAPGQTLVRSFEAAGRYSYSGMKSCSIGQVSTLAVEVTPRGRLS
ncbi:MAG: hypothetical protein EPO26_17345 [Chloroflexota bacterium]|nr:MAG: hypothetical protein EPO26_17345 [Chloroflexota bacterium]